MGLEAATICEQPLRGAEAVGDKGSLARIARGRHKGEVCQDDNIQV